MDTLIAHLAAHQFRALFIERLGWDRAQGCLLIGVDGHEYRFETIAHKRGLAVMECRADRYTMFNRRRLRLLQKQILKHAHEHIVIYRCDDPRKQVWQWAVHLPDGRRLRHRKHPFFSDSPPAALLQRLAQLRFSLQEEEHVTLVDALARVRAALDTEADLNLFVNRPWYAEQSDRLAIAMQSGESEAMHEFIQFHLPLASWGAKRWLRHLRGVNEDDAIQIARLGLIQAAKRFDRGRGTQFSTYATYWIRQACQRHAHEMTHFIHVPVYLRDRCRSVRRAAERATVRRGRDAAIEESVDALRKSEKLALAFARLEVAERVVYFSESGPGLRRPISTRLARDDPSIHQESRLELYEALRAAIADLPPRLAQIARMRYGLDGPVLTLQEVGEVVGCTKARVGQLQREIEERLRKLLLNRDLGFERRPSGTASESSVPLNSGRKGAPSNGSARDCPSHGSDTGVCSTSASASDSSMISHSAPGLHTQRRLFAHAN